MGGAIVDDNDYGVDEDEQDSERVDEERGDDDAPHPSEQAEQDSPRQELGYVDNAIQVARKGPWLGAGETSTFVPSSSKGPGTCAVCGRSYAIKMLGECPHCQAQRNRRASDELAKVIRELKGGRTNPEQERRLVKQLRELGHPAITELLQSLEARNSVATAKPRSRL